MLKDLTAGETWDTAKTIPLDGYEKSGIVLDNGLRLAPACLLLEEGPNTAYRLYCVVEFGEEKERTARAPNLHTSDHETAMLRAWEFMEAAQDAIANIANDDIHREGIQNALAVLPGYAADLRVCEHGAEAKAGKITLCLGIERGHAAGHSEIVNGKDYNPVEFRVTLPQSVRPAFMQAVNDGFRKHIEEEYRPVTREGGRTKHVRKYTTELAPETLRDSIASVARRMPQVVVEGEQAPSPSGRRLG